MPRNFRGIGGNHPPSSSFVMNRDSLQANGLVGWWPTVGSKTAHILQDYSFGLDGTPSGSPTSVIDSEVGMAIDLEAGSSQYYDLGRTSPLDINGEVTMSAWYTIESLQGSGTYANLFSAAYDGSQIGYAIDLWDLDGTNAGFRVGCWDGSDHNVIWWGIPGLALNTWYQIVGLYDGADWKVYNNGVQTGTATKATGALGVGSQRNVCIGQVDNLGRYWDGKLADIRLYNRGLSPDEVRCAFNPQTRWDLYRPVKRIWPVTVAVVANAPTGHLLGPLYGPLGGPI